MTHRAHEQDEGAVRVREKDSLGQAKGTGLDRRPSQLNEASGVGRGRRETAQSKTRIIMKAIKRQNQGTFSLSMMRRALEPSIIDMTHEWHFEPYGHEPR